MVNYAGQGSNGHVILPEKHSMGQEIQTLLHALGHRHQKKDGGVLLGVFESALARAREFIRSRHICRQRQICRH